MELDDDIKERISIWVQLVEVTLNVKLAQENLSLEDWVSSSVEKGDIQFEEDQLTVFCNLGLHLPLDATALHQRLERARVAHQIPSFHNDVLDIWRAVTASPRQVETTYNAVFGFFESLENAVITQPSRLGKDTAVMQSLENHWKQPYVGPSCDLLRDKIRAYEEKFSVMGPSKVWHRRYYSKAVTFIQSSGAGKSRLAKEYGNICPLITDVIREPDSGFPPSHEQVYRFMRSSPSDELRDHLRSIQSSVDPVMRDERADNIWFHGVAIGILQSTFQHCERKVKEWMKNYAQHSSIKLAGNFREFLGDVNKVQMFYDDIVASARQILASCVKDQTFRHIFNNHNENIRRELEQPSCEPLEELHTAVKNFEKTLEYWHLQHKDDPLFTVVFDEVGSLMGESGNGRFIALNRTISAISNGHKIWYLFLSTESKLDALLPPDRALPLHSGPNKPSSRQPIPLSASRQTIPLSDDGPLDRYPPFTSFAVDIQDLKNGFQINPADESMLEFSELKHMSRFGRPLWSAYDEPDSLALSKLVGGGHRYDPTNRDHVFAALSVRLCLDIDLPSPVSYPLSQTAVNLHMRVVKSVDPSTGYLFTRTPAEPILALAAMKHLCLFEGSWEVSLHTFTSNILSLGAINKGLKGELFARLLFILARDCLINTQMPTKRVKTNRAVPFFTVKSFLQAILSLEYHADIELIDSTILDANLNFLMFTSTTQHLSSESFHHLCHSLLRRSAALQCAQRQELYDLFIPFYWGRPDQPYNLLEAGAILVKVKNQEDGDEHPPKRRRTESGKQFLFHNSGAKLLYILLDLGIDEPGVEVSYFKSSNSEVWTIHCTGHDENVFDCINKWGAVEPTRDFFNDIMKPTPEDEIAFNHDAGILDNVLNHDQLNRKLDGVEQAEGSRDAGKKKPTTLTMQGDVSNSLIQDSLSWRNRVRATPNPIVEGE